MTTFNKLLAIKDGGGNPGSPGSADSLNLSLADFDAAITSFDLTASANSLVAFDAASLDFGNSAANPAFNFLGTGDFAVAGDALFSATGGSSGDADFQVDGFAKFLGEIELQGNLGVGGNLTVTGTSGLTGNVSMTADASVGANLTVTGTSAFTGNVSMTNDLLVSGNGTVNGNLTVKGTLVTKNTESVLISDNYIDMNSDYTAVSPQDAGFTFNYSPIENQTISSLGANSITLSAAFAASVVAGDFILVAGLDAGLEANEGIYEVSTVAGATILINTAPSLSFVKASISAAAAPGATAKAALINLAVIRTSSAGKLEWATGANASLTFGEVPFDGYVGSQAWGGSFSVQETAGYSAPFSVKSDIGSDFLSVDPGAGAATLYGDLVINNSAATQSNGLGLQTAASDPAIGAGVGHVYVKSSASIDELFYISEIGGVDTAVQITKNGALNIDALTFSLQEAYNDGNTIDISANDRPLSIDIGAFSGDALSVIGPTNLDGALDASGIVSFASTGGNAGAPDLSVAGFAKIAQGLYVDSTLDVTGAANLTSTLGVTGAATLSSTLDVTGAVLLSSTLNVTDAATLNGAVVVDSTLSATGAVDFDSTLNVDGAVTFVSTLAVTGTSTLGVLDASGAATLSSTLGVTGAATLSSTLGVTGTSTLGVLDAGSTTLDDLAVSGGSSFSEVAASGAVILNDTLSVLLGATLGATLDVTGVATFLNSVTSNGTLTAENNLIVNGDYIRIAEAAEFSVPAADTGSVFVSEDPAAAGHAELWYHGDGTANAVMITKNGQLNIDVLTFSLQSAYDDGSAIVTDAINGAVSITAGAGLTDALDVVGDASFDGAMSATGAVDFDSTLNVDGAVTFASTLAVSGLSTLDSLSVTNNASVGGTFGATGAATLSDTLAVTGNITASADVVVAGILDLNGSVDADVTSFDVLSSGGLSLESATLLSITASASDVVVSASGTIKLKGSYVASNINANATAAQIGHSKAVSMTSAGLVAAQANAKDVIVLGVSVETIASSSTAFGKIAEFGVAQAAVEASISIVAGDKLYLSAATAGAVTNVAPTASDTTVFLMGVALTADASGLVTMALRQQFLYSNY